jgi:hypothetical protein
MIKNRDIGILFAIALVFSVASFRLGSSTIQLEQVVRTLVGSSSIRFDSVDSISIQRDGKLFVFEKQNASWSQTKPFSMQMDIVSMLDLIEAVQGVQVLGQLEGTASSDVTGVSEGANAITLSDGSSEITVTLGRKTLGGRAYARFQDDKIVIVDHSLHRRAIDMDHRLWRDVRLFPNFAVDGMRIERIIDGDSMVIDRNTGRWEMREPVATRVDQELFSEWVGRLAGARVDGYVLDSPSDYSMFGLEQPAAIFSATDRIGIKRTLLIGGRVSAGSQDRYVMLEGQPVVFSMKWDSLSGLFPVPEMFVDATGSGVSRFDVKRVFIRVGGTEQVFTRELERWVDANGVQTDNSKIDGMLTWVLDSKPPSVALGVYPRNDEVASVTLVGFDSSPLDTVRIALDQSGQWILENGDNVLRIHPPEAGSALAPFQVEQ